MSDYIITIEDWFFKYAHEQYTHFFGCPIVEVVRCRDCIRFANQEPGSEIGTCDLGLEDTGLYSIVEPNGFCAWGERRES